MLTYLKFFLEKNNFEVALHSFVILNNILLINLVEKIKLRLKI